VVIALPATVGEDGAATLRVAFAKWLRGELASLG